jgi:predicted flap endonuclease-1-like 5' DNA nuclease
MIELFNEYWLVLLVALAVAAIVALLLFRPRQRVRLTDSAPIRPHMTSNRDSRSENNDIASEAAAAACDVSGEIIGVQAHKHLSADAGALDDLQRIKGVGPKLADMLRGRGFMRFEQLAQLTPQEVEMLDDQLGPFRGRIRRDRIAEQATYLARGDVDGFEQHFGKLS